MVFADAVEQTLGPPRARLVFRTPVATAAAAVSDGDEDVGPDEG